MNCPDCQRHILHSYTCWHDYGSYTVVYIHNDNWVAMGSTKVHSLIGINRAHALLEFNGLVKMDEARIEKLLLLK